MKDNELKGVLLTGCFLRSLGHIFSVVSGCFEVLMSLFCSDQLVYSVR